MDDVKEGRYKLESNCERETNVTSIHEENIPMPLGGSLQSLSLWTYLSLSQKSPHTETYRCISACYLFGAWPMAAL